MFRSFLAAGLVLGLGGVASADRTDKTAVAVRTSGAITIDGRLDEVTWSGAAAFVADFAQKEPSQDAPPTERTEIAIAFDGDALYVAARMELADPSRLDAPMTRRDDTSGAERIIVSFDPYRSRRTAYSFAVTAAGVRADWIHTDDSEYERDHSWNPVWNAAIELGADAWTAEMRIPFSQLRFPDDPTPVWGVNFNRFVPRTREDDFWIVVPKDVTGWSSYFGELRGLDGIEQRLRLEVLPYVAGDMTVGLAEANHPPEYDAEAGVDLKLGLGPSLTLDATINPDFGQVEADPAVVNLSAYEVIFEEQRPFFVEGSQIFTSQPRTYYYSRRIGAGDARILGAGKLTGQLLRQTNLGALVAVTDEVDDAPRAGWGVLRVERELDDDASLLGVTATAVGRDVDAGVALAETALTGGADLRLRLGGGEWELAGGAGGSTVSGAPEAIAAIQRAPAHYYQRPDADHVELDPAATRISGWHADLRGGRREGDWRVEALLGAESPGLEFNDVGILNSADDIDASAGVARVETDPGRFLHSWSVMLHDAEAWNFAGDHKPGFTGITADLTLPSFLRLTFDASVTRPGLSDDKTRGGPLMGVGWGASWGAAINSNGSGPLVWGAHVGGEWSETEATGTAAGASVLWHVSPQLRLQIAPRIVGGKIHTQYLTTLEDGRAETYGNRYVFAELSLREIALQLRTQLSLTPDLTIDAYMEPFVSGGPFARWGELQSPGSRDLLEYEIVDDGDALIVSDGSEQFELPVPREFLYLSLRSTVVLRYELRPGSVLYAVWQQDRSDDTDLRASSYLGGLGQSFTAAGEHVVALKLSYWWSP